VTGMEARIAEMQAATLGQMNERMTAAGQVIVTVVFAKAFSYARACLGTP
jgi:hypothetical protein